MESYDEQIIIHKTNQIYKRLDKTLTIIKNDTAKDYYIDVYREMIAIMAIAKNVELFERFETLKEVYKGFESDYTYSIWRSTSSKCDFDHIDFAQPIIERTIYFDAVIRCLEALNRGKNKREVYKTYISDIVDEKTHENTYFGDKLNEKLKQEVCHTLDHLLYATYEDKTNFFQNTKEQKDIEYEDLINMNYEDIMKLKKYKTK